MLCQDIRVLTFGRLKVSSYIARYPVCRTPLSALHFIPRPSQLLWEAFSHAAIARILFVHISNTVCIARYSFIQLSELWQRRVIKLAKGSKRPHWDLKSGSLDWESGLVTGMPSRPHTLIKMHISVAINASVSMEREVAVTL